MKGLLRLLNHPVVLQYVYFYWSRFHAWIFLMGWGIFLAVSKSYDVSASYDSMEAVASELIFGGFFAVCGLVLGVISRAERMRLMIVTGGLGVATTTIWLFFLLSEPRSTAVWTYGVLALGDHFALLHLYVMKYSPEWLIELREGDHGQD